MERNNELGTIKIPDSLFERLVKDSILMSEGRDVLSPGRKSLSITKGDELVIEFHVVHKFGTSIRYSSKTILDNIENTIRGMEIGMPCRIIMRIVAIKARRSLKMDTQITRKIP